jgi:hypothetical protein
LANAKSGLLGEHTHRDSIQVELTELVSDENDSVLLTTTGRPARKKDNYAGHKFEIGRHFAPCVEDSQEERSQGEL